MAREARRAFGAAIHKARLRRLVGQRSSSGQVKPGRKRVLFLSSNGVGIGHLTRLFAIARRMPNEVEPVFATLSQAMPVVEQAGYPVEYLPFHVYANCDPQDWNEWLAEHLTQIIDFHSARVVVFDGGSPYRGLIEAVAPRRDVKLIWVRRGMWREEQNNAEAIRRQHFFDLIIEPGDVAEAMDRGATADNRAVALNPADSLPRSGGSLSTAPPQPARLGLDPDKPAMLIQLGRLEPGSRFHRRFRPEDPGGQARRPAGPRRMADVGHPVRFLAGRASAAWVSDLEVLQCVRLHDQCGWLQ